LARPARLIWPTRTADADEGTLYTVLVHVDADGYVDGVRLRGASTSRRDQKAADAVWRFRYDPARDEGGRPIASVVEQPFVVRD
jgi:TonB family protein